MVYVFHGGALAVTACSLALFKQLLPSSIISSAMRVMLDGGDMGMAIPPLSVFRGNWVASTSSHLVEVCALVIGLPMKRAVAKDSMADSSSAVFRVRENRGPLYVAP